MTRKRVTFAAFAVTTIGIWFAGPTNAHAWNCLQDSCPTWCDLPITYTIGAVPDGLDEAEAVSEIRRAFDAWNAPDCVDLGFTYLGRASETAETPTIFVSTVDPWPEELGPSNIVHAVARTSFDMETNCLTSPTDGDPLININPAHNWSTGGAPGGVDLYTVILQQVGLALGIANASADAGGTVMQGLYDGPIDTGILEDDENAVCYLYADGTVEPGTSLPPDPVEVPENCEACTSDSDCADDQRCLSSPAADSAICVLTCDDHGLRCPEGSTCLLPPEESEGICLVQESNQEFSCPASLERADAPDAGPGETDMGVSETADLGSDGEAGPDMGEEGIDDIETSGSGCCAVVAAPGASEAGLLSLILIGLLAGRRRVTRP